MRLLLLLAALPTLLGAALDDEIVDEFKKYFRKYKDTPTRVEAILALEGVESEEVVRVLVPVLRDTEGEVVRAAVRVLGGFQTSGPIESLLEQLEAKKKPEVVAGLLDAVGRGGYAGARSYVLPRLADSSWEVRRKAIACLAAIDGLAAAPDVLPLCEDKEVVVRCAAFDGLARIGTAEVLAPAVLHLADDSWQVRSSAIRALARVRHRDAIGPLIDRMAIEEGRLIEDIAIALDAITGRQFGRRLDGWQSFWAQYGDTFVIPTDAELARLHQRQAERRAAYSGAGSSSTKYHGVETPSRSIVFVIDVSGSMEQEVSERERYADGDYPSFERIDIVKTELTKTIQGLESYVRFNVLAFATDVRAWKKKMVAANALNKSSASAFLARLEPIGGASKQGLAEAGLVASADLSSGKTNTYAALMASLQASDDRRAQYAVGADTVFFLSDGRPSTGQFVDPDDIREAVRRANELRRVVIHTIAIGEFQKGFMRQLANENGGVFVDLGK